MNTAGAYPDSPKALTATDQPLTSFYKPVEPASLASPSPSLAPPSPSLAPPSPPSSQPSIPASVTEPEFRAVPPISASPAGKGLAEAGKQLARS